MKFSYDPRYNVGYIRFKDKKADAESIKLSEELVVDLAPDGTVYGIELLNANEQTGEKTRFPLSKKTKKSAKSASRPKRRPTES